MYSVLVIDDSLTVRMDLVQLFSTEGFTVSHAATAAAGREALAASAADLVILDVVLPDGDGVELLHELRATEHGKRAVVIMLSSELGSLTALLDPESEFYGINSLGYNSSKTALNAATVSFAKALEPFGIKVNAVDPGFTATDMNGGTGYRSVAQAAEIPRARSIHSAWPGCALAGSV